MLMYSTHVFCTHPTCLCSTVRTYSTVPTVLNLVSVQLYIQYYTGKLVHVPVCMYIRNKFIIIHTVVFIITQLCVTVFMYGIQTGKYVNTVIKNIDLQM